MRTFRDQLTSDLSVFINTRELADNRNVNGRTIPCVVDTISISDMKQEVGLNGMQFALHCLKSDCPNVTSNDVIFVDDLKYTVLTVIDNEGISTLTLELARDY